MLGKSVPIELGGKTRNLKYGFNALVDLEETLDIPIQDLMKSFTKGVKLGLLRGLLWAGLRHEEPGLTLEQVGDMVEASLKSGADFSTIGKAIAEAVTEAFPPAKKAEVKPRIPKN